VSHRTSAEPDFEDVKADGDDDEVDDEAAAEEDEDVFDWKDATD
jgi:hypothetical protein